MDTKKFTTLGQMKDLAQQVDAKNDEQDELLKELDEENDQAVRYTPQTLTAEQKAQARANIGASASGEGGGAGIEVTAQPGQLIIVKEVDESGKPTAWEAVDPTHWVEKAVLLEETDAVEGTDPNYGKCWSINKAPMLTAGETYTVIYNGVPYDCVCHSSEDAGLSFDETDAFVMGNFSVVGGENTGEPFAMVIFPAYQSIVSMDLTGATSVRIGIIGGETIHKLDGKFLPNGVPYVEESVDDYTVILPDYTISEENSEEDMAAIPALGLVAGNTYVVTLSGTEYTCVAWEMTESGMTAVGLGDVYTMSGGQMGTGPTGEPFVLVELPPEYAAEMGMNVEIQPLTDNFLLPVTFSIVMAGGVVIHKIDPRCLPDGLPYVEGEGTRKTVLAETTFTGLTNDLNMLDHLIPLEVNKTYFVNWNGTEYVCESRLVIDTIIVIGNGGVSFGTGNSEPFGIVYANNDGQFISVIISNDGSTEATVSIEMDCTVIHKMDVRFVPDSVIAGLSSNDYTTEEKNKLAGIAAGATKITVDYSLSTTSSNAIQNRSVTQALNTKAGKIVYNERFTIDDKTVFAEIGAEIFNDYTNNKAVGAYSHAEGFNNTVTGDYSHAEGGNTIASSLGSHAEGISTTASGDGAHAEGCNVEASGDYSHAEGISTTASGDYSHAEGRNTTASGPNSHAEGGYTKATGAYSHAEGCGTTASGGDSHAEGWSTTASGGDSHAEGESTTASGNNSHAEGWMTLASGDHSHAEGHDSIASGSYSHAEGDYALAFGEASHAEGSSYYEMIHLTGEANTTVYNVVSGDVSRIREGYVGRFTQVGEYATVVAIDTVNNTITFDKTLSSDTAFENKQCAIYSGGASGKYSHAEGSNTTASGGTSHAEGSGTTASGYSSHAEGSSTKALTEWSHAEGSNTTASGGTSHAEGSGTTASGSYSHAEGYCTTASYEESHAEGRVTIASGLSSHAEGCNLLNFSCTLSGEADTVTYQVQDSNGVTSSLIGFEVTGNLTDRQNLPKVVDIDTTNKTITLDKTLSSNAVESQRYYFVKGGASGSYSHSEGCCTTATGGSGAHSEGYCTTAYGASSHAEGWSTTASGGDSHAEGESTTASGNNSHAEGWMTLASGNNSHAEGYKTVASRTYQHVQGKYNIGDENLAHVVGNGTTEDKRSNAHTLDWDGNAWYAGDVYVGSTSGTNKDKGSRKLATESYVDNKIDNKTFNIYLDDAGVADKSCDEIYQAMLDNKNVLLHFGDYVCSCTNCSPTGGAFFSMIAPITTDGIISDISNILVICVKPDRSIITKML